MLRHTLITALVFTLVVSLPGCGSGSKPRPEPAAAKRQPSLTRFEYARVLMGSKARIVLYQENEQEAASKARIAFEEIEQLNDVLSDYDPNSETMRLCTLPAEQWHPISNDLRDVLLKSAKIWSASEGAFDPTVGPLTQLWRQTSKSGTRPESTELRNARSHVGFGLLEIDSTQSKVRMLIDGMRLDFGGIGKGYAAGRALETLKDLDAPIALVDLGGDLAIGKAPPNTNGWIVTIDTGVSEPLERRLANTGVATSGDLYRFVEIDGKRYSHILDPRTGMGLTTRVAVTVIADEAWLADALASAYSVLGRDGSEALHQTYPKAEVFITTAPQ